MAMTREQLSELMSAYLDGEVDPREKSLVENALRADPAARRLLEELRQTAAVVGSLPRHAAPPHLAMDLDAQLERAQLLSGFSANENDSALPKTPWHASLKAAAMLAIVLGAGWWFLSVQQEHRPDGLAKSPSREAKELVSESRAPSRENPMPLSVAIEAETLIASGADPVVLVKQSFEPEPIRLRVVARDAAERDALSKRFTTQLAESNTENLANRGTSSGKKQPVGAFYLEGKPGVNYANAHEKQILVRLPHADAQRIVDDVEAGGKIPAEHLALQVGPAVVRGPANARGMLQMMADKDKPAQEKPQPPASTFADSKKRSPSMGLLNTLGEIVGLGPLMQNPPASHKGKGDRTAMASSDRTDNERVEGTSGAASELLDTVDAPTDDRVAIATKAEVDENAEAPTHRSLVSKRLEIARAKRTEENTSGPPDAGALRTQPSSDLSTTSPSVAATNQFITMVIEFAIPESKPPVRTNTGRNRS